MSTGMITNRLDNIRFVNRVSYLQDLCLNKKVLHLGATASPTTKNVACDGTLLHFHIGKVAREIVGLDLDETMIKYLQENHNIYDIRCGNIEILEDYPEERDFDIILGGEIFEHLSNPGTALDAIYSVTNPSTKLIITVPNAYSIKGFLRALARRELIHPDHTLHHSPHTLRSLLERHGFRITDHFSYVMGGKGMFALLANSLIKSSPQLAEGIGVVCQKNEC
jgi:2-polyprenyl-3-methyl-5-hydroxy-6-metoxy-1,4-benzoquinol methylase